MPTPLPTDPHLSRQVCTELATALSAATWTTAIPSITAAFRRLPDYVLEDLGSLKVSVVPGQVGVNQTEPQPRGADFFEVRVAIVLAKHVASEQDVADLEDLNMAIVDAIRSYKVTPAFPSQADWTDISITSPFDPQALNERNVFLSQTDVTYWVPKDKTP